MILYMEKCTSCHKNHTKQTNKQTKNPGNQAILLNSNKCSASQCSEPEADSPLIKERLTNIREVL
jgi:hypothetical protein